MRRTNIGGQGVLEGVMMRGTKKSALAVRNTKQKLVTKEWENNSPLTKRAFYRLPIIRGVIMFFDTMVQGVKTIADAAKMLDESVEYEPSRMEKFIAGKTGKSAMDVMMVMAVVVALALAVGLFFILPSILSGFFKTLVHSSILLNLIDGGIRMLLFLGYIALIANMKDIKRMFRYHGAEHKTINCYEHELPMTVENIQTQSTLHPRCGTSYLLLVMVVSILIFAVFGWSDNPLLRIVIRLLLLPIVAGVAYEILKGAAKSDHILVRIIRWPGMQLQRLTTAQPDDSMVEAALVAFEIALEEKSPEEIQEMIRAFDRSEPEEKEEAEQEPTEETQPAAPMGEIEQEPET